MRPRNRALRRGGGDRYREDRTAPLAARRATECVPLSPLPTTPACYMCDAPAVSREHAPPACLFPEQKDLRVDLRRNLLTVPSCERHNATKCSDDQFLLVSLAGVLGGNAVGLGQGLTKARRTFARGGPALIHAALGSVRRERHALPDGRKLDVAWGTPDFARLDRCFDRIARALYFHEHGSRCEGITHCVYMHTLPGDCNDATFRDFLRHKAALELAAKPYRGANPSVFTYRAADPDAAGRRLYALTFYGHLDVFVVIAPAGLERGNLAADLIDRGIPTTISSGGRAWRFNQTAD